MVFTNENGLFIRAKQAKENTTKAQEDENTIIDGYENEIDKYLELAKKKLIVVK